MHFCNSPLSLACGEKGHVRGSECLGVARNQLCECENMERDAQHVDKCTQRVRVEEGGSCLA